MRALHLPNTQTLGTAHMTRGFGGSLLAPPPSGVARVICARGHDRNSAPLLGPTDSEVYMVHFRSIWYFNEVEYRLIILYTRGAQPLGY